MTSPARSPPLTARCRRSRAPRTPRLLWRGRGRSCFPRRRVRGASGRGCQPGGRSSCCWVCGCTGC
eukprot:746044-Hanusia_phi.AAC.2